MRFCSPGGGRQAEPGLEAQLLLLPPDAIPSQRLSAVNPQHSTQQALGLTRSTVETGYVDFQQHVESCQALHLPNSALPRGIATRNQGLRRHTHTYAGSLIEPVSCCFSAPAVLAPTTLLWQQDHTTGGTSDSGA